MSFHLGVAFVLEWGGTGGMDLWFFLLVFGLGAFEVWASGAIACLLYF